MRFVFINLIGFGNLQSAFQELWCFLLFVLKHIDDWNCYVHPLLWLRCALLLPLLLYK